MDRKRNAARRRLIRWLKFVIRECEQMATDKASWNENRPEEMPFDNGGDLITASLARRALACMEAEPPHFPQGLFVRIMAQLDRDD